MSAFSSCRAVPRVTRDGNREKVDVCVGRQEDQDVHVGATSIMDSVTQYAAPIAGVAAGLALGVFAFGGRIVPTLLSAGAGGAAGYFLGKQQI